MNSAKFYMITGKTAVDAFKFRCRFTPEYAHLQRVAASIIDQDPSQVDAVSDLLEIEAVAVPKMLMPSVVIPASSYMYLLGEVNPLLFDTMHAQWIGHPRLSGTPEKLRHDELEFLRDSGDASEREEAEYQSLTLHMLCIAAAYSSVDGIVIRPSIFKALDAEGKALYPCTYIVNYYDNTGAKSSKEKATYHATGTDQREQVIAQWNADKAGRNWQFISTESK